ncbi:acyltransferase family protein [Roseicella aquatilis]|nr:acyltransferase [Roseicella aquatilis]
MTKDGLQGSGQTFFFALEGLRGLVAIMVMIMHYAISSGFNTEATVFIPRTYLAVDFFFVLSGFIIAHAYERRLLTGMSLPDFVLRRVVRLWPLLILSLSLTLTAIFLAPLLNVEHSKRSLSIASFLLSVFLLPTPEALAPLPPLVFPLNVPAWSLSVEVGANLAYAALVSLLATRRLGLFVIASALMLVVATSLGSGDLNSGGMWHNYGGGWLRVCWGFSAGLLVYRLWLRRPPKPLPPMALYALGLGFVGISVAKVESAAFDLVAVIVLFPLAVYFGTGIQLSGFSKALVKQLGHLSYSLYITHIPLIILIKVILLAAHIDLARNALAIFLLGSLLAIAFAWVLDMIYDKPVRAWLSRRLLVRGSRINIPVRADA